MRAHAWWIVPATTATAAIAASVAIVIAIVIAVACASCELATHAFDYGIALPETPLCQACPNARDAASSDLRHVPCAIGDAAPDLPRAFVYAARRGTLGHADSFTGMSADTFDLGLDLDCSRRPAHGLPVLCAPRSGDGWDALPRGIDDALLERVIAPTYDATPASRTIDLDAAISDTFEHGVFGFVVAVDHWNGRPDDPHVEVTIRTSPGLASGAAPAWQGDDAWRLYPDVDVDGSRPFFLDRVPGYVAGGVLVVDARAKGPGFFRFGPPCARFEVLASDLVLAGTISATGLVHFTMSGLLDEASARDASSNLSALLSRQPGTFAGAFLAPFADRMVLAADMPGAPGTSPDEPCDAISFAWAFDAFPAQLGQTDSSDVDASDATAACP